MDKKRMVTIAIPVLVAGTILGSWWLLSRSGGEPAAPVAEGTVAPQDPTHERASLQEQLQKNPGHAPILLRLSELASSEGKHKEAADFLRRVLEGDPKNADARLELGRALFDAGDMDGAIRETKQLLADHPDHVDGLYNLGAIYANQDQFDLARPYWSRAVEVDPSSDSGTKAALGLQQIGSSSVSLPADLFKNR
jgi:tetratricopeptide (TPR) repeat protein